MNYKNIYGSIKEAIIHSLKHLEGIDYQITESFTIEIPKDKGNGDISTNAAMIISGFLRKSESGLNVKSPIEVANFIKEELLKDKHFESIEIAGPGFINFTLKKWVWHKILEEILQEGANFGNTNIGGGKRVNIEFVSANPTGPMHIGHSRPAIYGDVLSSIMKYLGFDVTKEYYINDAGGQIEILSESAYLRYLEVFAEKYGYKIEIPTGYYPGEYLKDLAIDIKKEHGEKYISEDSNSMVLPLSLKEEFTQLVIDKMLDMIKKDLADLKIHHDVFFSEKSLYANNIVASSIEILKSKDLVYMGKLEAPKGTQDPEWEDREQLLFKSTLFDDDQDRSITKSDGSLTYFAGDVAYAKSKIDRGFLDNIIILGADHAGYVKRLKAVYNALSSNTASINVILCQMVHFVENGQPVKMSKRAGNFTTVADVVREVGPDVLRFMMLTRRNDMILDFDLDLVKSMSKENPVFYVQYARVRALSILNNAKDNFPDIFKALQEKKYDLSHLSKDHEIYLIRDLSLFPKVLIDSISKAELHKIAYFLQNISANFHACWNLGKENEEYRFITDNNEVSCARLALVTGIMNVITIGLRLMGISPMEKM